MWANPLKYNLKVKNMKKSLIVFSIVFVLMFSMAASVFGTKVLSIEQIPNDPLYNQYPDVYGDYIVWSDDIKDYDVLAYNILTKQKFMIKQNTGQEAHPAIWEDIVVWEEAGGLNYYNLKTRQYNSIPDSADAWYPAIYGDIVVWEDNGINAYNLKTRQPITIPGSGNGEYADIYGDIVIWRDDGDIYGFNLKSSTTSFLIVDTTGNSYRPRIYGDIIVWAEEGKICKYNIKTSEKTIIYDGNREYADGDVDIYGDIVVWQEGDYQIYGYNLKTGQEFLIRDTEEDGKNVDWPAIYCGRVVWYEDNYYNETESNYEVFLANLDVVCETAKKSLPMDWIMKKFGLGKYKNN